MIIESINIKSFGMITDMNLAFTDSINVIVGHNEAGKSTIAAFIKYMLYGFGNEKVEGVTDERTRGINWDTGTAQGSMTVRVADKRYLISRLTEKVDNGQRVSYKEDSSIIDLETGSPAFGKVPAGEVFFGVDRELFENTAFIGQIGDTSINEGSVKQSIENILFSGNERINNQRAASKVAVKMDTLLHKGGSGGAIYELVRRQEQLAERFAAADGDNKEILIKEAKLHEIRARRKEQKELLDKLCDLDVCYRNMLIIQTFDELHKLEARLDEKSEEYAEFVRDNTRADFVPTPTYLTEIAVARRGVDDAYRSLLDREERYARERDAVGITKETESAIELSDKFGGESAVMKRARSLRGGVIKNITFGVLLFLAALAVGVYELVATGAMAGLVPRILIGIVGALALGGAGCFMLAMTKVRRELTSLQSGFSTVGFDDLMTKLSVIGEERGKRDRMVRDTEDARISLERGKEEYSRAKSELLEVILRWGEEPPTKDLNEFLDGLERRAKEFLDAERKLLDEKGELEMAVRELRAKLSDKSEVDIRAQVSPLKRKVLSEINHESIIDGIADCKLKILAEDKLSEEVEGELATLKIRATDPGELYSKMQENDARITELKKTHKACAMALSAIESASDNLRKEISPRLGEYATSLVGVMTDSKYESIDVSDGLKVSFVAPDGEHKSVDFLSGGTRDLTYISLRMALIDILYSEKPPITFDESFAHQDNQRAASMMRAVKKLASEGQQSFIFTCREREAKLARAEIKTAGVYKLTSGDD